MKPIIFPSRRPGARVRVEIEDAFPEDKHLRYLLLHFSGPQLQWRDPECKRRWRISWDHDLPPMLYVRGILFGVHFMFAGRIAR